MAPDVQCITLIFDMNGFSMSNMVNIDIILIIIQFENLIWSVILEENVFLPRRSVVVRAIYLTILLNIGL